MNEDTVPLYGMECAKCTRPARSHNFKTGLTVHESPYASRCQIHPPRRIPVEVHGA